MGITEILGRIWLFSTNKTKSFESFSKQPTQLIVDLNSSLQHIIVTKDCYFLSNTYKSNFEASFYNKEELNKERYVPFLSNKPGFCTLHKNSSYSELLFKLKIKVHILFLNLSA